MNDFWREQFEHFDADGVDFVPLMFNPCCTPQSEIYCSYIKAQFEQGVLYPRSNYLLWKMINGLKCYLIERKDLS
jgi:hypothetical protein